MNHLVDVSSNWDCAEPKSVADLRLTAQLPIWSTAIRVKQDGAGQEEMEQVIQEEMRPVENQDTVLIQAQEEARPKETHLAAIQKAAILHHHLEHRHNRQAELDTLEANQEQHLER